MASPNGSLFTVGELFCGAGGLALGLKRAGLDHLWGIDNDPWACATFKRNLGSHIICADVREVDFSILPQPAGLAFGFPCNDFSVVGDRTGTRGAYGILYRQAVRALNEINPVWFIAENVPGLLSAEGGEQALQDFANAGPGYQVAVHLYRFEEYGVPQKRWRVVAVGIREDIGLLFRPPAPTHNSPVTVEEALRDVEKVPHNNEKTRHKPHVVELLRHIPEGENAWSPAVPEHLRLNVPRCRLSLIYRRLKRDEPAYTVVGSGGGGTHMYHYAEPRALTNRERARLQTFPDDFVFEGRKESVRRQIGMAVPPLAAEKIGRALVALLSGEPYRSVEPSEGVIRPTRRAVQGELFDFRSEEKIHAHRQYAGAVTT